MNANFLATAGDERLLVRVYSTDAATADRECDLLKFLERQDVLVPRVLARMQIRDSPVAILEFIDGITLEARLPIGGVPPQLGRMWAGSSISRTCVRSWNGPRTTRSRFAQHAR